MKKNKKKVCFVITSQVHYARSSTLLNELNKHPEIELSILIGGSAVLPHYGNVKKLLQTAKLTITEEVQFVLEGGTPLAMARTAGLGVMEFASAFNRIKPDMVVVRADRYEILGAAMAAAYLNIPIAHLEGGDLSGTIDESVRHAITKLAHLHFVTNNDARNRLLRMGEDPKQVFTAGAPEVEYAAMVADGKKKSLEHLNESGVGERIDFTKHYLIVMHHPVTSEYGDNKTHTQALLRAVNDCAVQTIWFWPNIDAGTDEVSEAIRTFRELEDSRPRMRFLKYIAPDEFITLLNGAVCLVGNSSAGIKETSYLGVPVVNIGTRQQGRMRAGNVLDVEEYSQEKIRTAIKKQISKKRYTKSNLYYKKESSKIIANKIAHANVSSQKKFFE